MENTFNKAFIAMSLLMGCLVYGQEENDVDFTHIYNKWVFSAEESSNSIRVYRNEEFFGDADEGQEKPLRWRFAAHSDVFINSPYTKEKWTSRRIIGCGSVPREKWKWTNKRRIGLKPGPRTAPKYYYSPPSRTKGRWELVEENGVTSLLLHYYKAEKGKPFQLDKTVKYLVVHLEQDLMVLTMINGRNAL